MLAALSILAANLTSINTAYIRQPKLRPTLYKQVTFQLLRMGRNLPVEEHRHHPTVNLQERSFRKSDQVQNFRSTDGWIFGLSQVKGFDQTAVRKTAGNQCLKHT
ncbi:uncharacterized protein LOC111267356 isoform X2 [Varroa jacobsoni]|uniref:uncharacterized protein LOC111267356 isoform X2 n=1 Tax=Varroa jacobsoni TaxID=62625 RepID=UPI000BF751CF|nr:uncharacterized protein LOC111267356 isoform X2 [Varroa jacobsoni]